MLAVIEKRKKIFVKKKISIIISDMDIS